MLLFRVVQGDEAVLECRHALILVGCRDESALCDALGIPASVSTHVLVVVVVRQCRSVSLASNTVFVVTILYQ